HERHAGFAGHPHPRGACEERSPDPRLRSGGDGGSPPGAARHRLRRQSLRGGAGVRRSRHRDRVEPVPEPRLGAHQEGAQVTHRGRPAQCLRAGPDEGPRIRLHRRGAVRVSTRRFLVTGGAGFIGSHIVEALLRRGERVAVLDDFSTGRRENLEAALRSRTAGAPAPLSPYAVSKLSGEHYCKIAHALYGLETIALRYFNIFGPRQDPTSQYAAVVPNFVTAVVSGRAPIVYGDGLQSRDFTYIDN